METNKIRKGIIKMKEMIVFAITLVAAQTVAGLIMMGIMMKVATSKKFIKKYYYMIMGLSEEIAEEALAEIEEEA